MRRLREELDMLNDKLESIKDGVCSIGKGIHEYLFEDTNVTRYDLFIIGFILLDIATFAPGFECLRSSKK